MNRKAISGSFYVGNKWLVQTHFILDNSVQPIGGVNEKIEGFFDICKEQGLSGKQGVIIPASNVKYLMLRWDVVHTAKAKQFHIYTVETVDEALHLLSDIEPGVINDKAGC